MRRLRVAFATIAVLACGFSVAAQAVTFKLEIQEASSKDPNWRPTQADRKNPRAMANKFKRTTIERRVVKATYGQTALVALPGGAHINLTPVAFEAGKVKVHMRYAYGATAGFELDVKMPEGKQFPLPGGPIPGKAVVLIVLCTASVD